MPDDPSLLKALYVESDGKIVTLEEAEKMLLEKLKKCEDELENTVLDLVLLYSRLGQQDIAVQYLERLITATADPEKKAQYFLRMGQLMEQTRNYEAAITFYRHAFSLEPTHNEVWYFINNNLGFCLNHFNRHVEAEPYCRAAIKIDPLRQNAYKNLGISLEGQGKYTRAVEFYIKAVQANAADARAFVLLEDLVRRHQEIKFDIPDIQTQIEKCRQAVEQAGGYKNRLDRN
jgi:tetratricopeptide (TPR) repeat protein